MHSAAVEISRRRKINIVGLERKPNFLKYRSQSIYGGNSNEYLFIFAGYALKTNASSVGGGVRFVNKRLFYLCFYFHMYIYIFLFDRFLAGFVLLYVSEKKLNTDIK